MAEKRKPKSVASGAKRAPKATAAKTKKPGTKSTKTSKSGAAPEPKKRGAKSAKKRSTTTGKNAAPARNTPVAKARKRTAMVGTATEYKIGEPVLDPIGDVLSEEARTYLGDAETTGQAEMEAYREETETAAENGTLEPEEERAATEKAARANVAEDAETERRPKLERLQKILSQAGIASRRRAEEMIAAGRVMVNGKVVTQLGSKADPGRDHIRVDGKLLQGVERHRYFVLNKPRGYVTTVSDPEGRPTVMEFFANARERLYPVGRLDYQSEGLLMMTNDGELANLLSRAGSGVEKTYLVKVAGQPSEEQLERLRGGVAIEKGEACSERLRTAPARIWQVRAGDNPWYEVVLTEGRNRELRKMFAAIGHFAEKIRRVGYGPLELDVEPRKIRELTADEVHALRMAAEGKIEVRRLNIDRMLPKEAGKPAEKQRRFAEQRGYGEKPQWQREGRGQKKEWRPRKPESGGERRESRGGSGREFRSGPRREFGKEPRREFRGEGRREFRAGGPRRERSKGRFDGAERRPVDERAEKPRFERGKRPQFVLSERSNWKKSGGAKRRFEGGGGKAFGKGAKFGGKPGVLGRSRSESGRDRKFGGNRPGAARGGWKRG